MATLTVINNPDPAADSFSSLALSPGWHQHQQIRWANFKEDYGFLTRGVFWEMTHVIQHQPVKVPQ